MRSAAAAARRALDQVTRQRAELARREDVVGGGQRRGKPLDQQLERIGTEDAQTDAGKVDPYSRDGVVARFQPAIERQPRERKDHRQGRHAVLSHRERLRSARRGLGDGGAPKLQGRRLARLHDSCAIGERVRRRRREPPPSVT